jgi:signal peptidase I
MTPPTASEGSLPRAASPAVRALMTLVAPALVALVLLRVAVPSRLEGARGGVLGLLATLGDEQSLLVFIALFLVLSEVGRYWYRQGRAEALAAPVAKPKVFRFVVAVGAMAVLAFFVRSSVAGVVRVVGPSMLPTLEIGDRVLVNRVAYGFTLPLGKARLGGAAASPRRGDLVVFTATVPGMSGGPQRLVKRVLGIAGDRIDADGGLLNINGWSIPSCDAGPYAVLSGRLTVRGRLTVEFLGDQTYLTVRKPSEQAFPAYTVKPGEVFVVGDDRGLSSDSRLWGDSAGTGVPISALEGRVSRVLVGSSPDGRLDLSRLLARPLGLEVRQPNLDLDDTKKRIDSCVKSRPGATWPPAPTGG